MADCSQTNKTIRFIFLASIFSKKRSTYIKGQGRCDFGKVVRWQHMKLFLQLRAWKTSSKVCVFKHEQFSFLFLSSKQTSCASDIWISPFRVRWNFGSIFFAQSDRADKFGNSIERIGKDSDWFYSGQAWDTENIFIFEVDCGKGWSSEEPRMWESRA